ncbi:conserved hypothetical protein [Coccidioides posadasii str. Silveira]|uniref:Uncharacterized protein n=1 Tax=Coccidioides posadasii (strain RMSCC 757 / Silveira) TaxID=443226 RepID=E9CZZ3_COCPS|nr:conserved hypothetical protein [Coccidioides posadasii str. Silveira]
MKAEKRVRDQDAASGVHKQCKKRDKISTCVGGWTGSLPVSLGEKANGCLPPIGCEENSAHFSNRPESLLCCCRAVAVTHCNTFASYSGLDAGFQMRLNECWGWLGWITIALN